MSIQKSQLTKMPFQPFIKEENKNVQNSGSFIFLLYCFNYYRKKLQNFKDRKNFSHHDNGITFLKKHSAFSHIFQYNFIV